jgi:hypothetical protein
VKVATDSGLNLPPNPEKSCRLFRAKPATFSGGTGTDGRFRPKFPCTEAVLRCPARFTSCTVWRIGPQSMNMICWYRSLRTTDRCRQTLFFSRWWAWHHRLTSRPAHIPSTDPSLLIGFFLNHEGLRFSNLDNSLRSSTPMPVCKNL